MKNIFKPLLKRVLIPLGLTAAALATDPAIHKKIFGSGRQLITSNEEVNDIMKIVESLKESGFLINGVSKTITNEAKEQKGDFLGMFLDTLGASLLGILLTGNGVKRPKFYNIPDRGVMREGEGTIRAGQSF